MQKGMTRFGAISSFLFLAVVLFSVAVSAATLEQKTLGDENAPVTLEMFTDFQGPFDARWYEQTLPLIDENYIEERDVKWVVRHFPLSFHENARRAAYAAECAAEQDKFFEYIEILYNNQGQLGDEDLQGYAILLGLDLEEFNDCRGENRIREIVDEDIEYGERKGVRGVPAFFVNDFMIVGAQPYEVFEDAIEGALGDREITHEDIDRRLRNIEERLDRNRSLLEEIIDLLKKLFNRSTISAVK